MDTTNVTKGNRKRRGMMKKDLFDKMHVAYRVFIIIAVTAAAIWGWWITSSFTYMESGRNWVPMPWPPDMVPHPHPPEPPKPPPGPTIV